MLSTIERSSVRARSDQAIEGSGDRSRYRSIQRSSGRSIERSSDRPIDRSSNRATERSRGRNLANNYLRKVHKTSSRASSDTMPKPSDVENCWVTLFTRIGASNHSNIVKQVTRNKKTAFFNIKFGPDQDHLGIIGVSSPTDLSQS